MVLWAAKTIPRRWVRLVLTHQRPPRRLQGQGPMSTGSTFTASTMSGAATPLAKYVYPTPVSYDSKIEVLAQGPDRDIYWMYSSSAGSILDASSTSSLTQLSSAAAFWQHGVVAFADNTTAAVHMFAAFPNVDHYSVAYRYHTSNMTWKPSGGWVSIDSYVNTSASAIHWPADDSHDEETYLFALDPSQHLY